MKKCLQCKEELPATYFHHDKSKSDGLKIYCIPCVRAQRAKRGRPHERKKAVNWLKRNREAMTDKWWKKISHYHGLDFRVVMQIFESQERKCFYCKISLDYKNLHIEHYYPKKKDRIVIACADCNRLKWGKDGDEFIIFLKEYISRFR